VNRPPDGIRLYGTSIPRWGVDGRRHRSQNPLKKRIQPGSYVIIGSIDSPSGVIETDRAPPPAPFQSYSVDSSPSTMAVTVASVSSGGYDRTSRLLPGDRSHESAFVVPPSGATRRVSVCGRSVRLVTMSWGSSRVSGGFVGVCVDASDDGSGSLDEHPARNAIPTTDVRYPLREGTAVDRVDTGKLFLETWGRPNVFDRLSPHSRSSFTRSTFQAKLFPPSVGVSRTNGRSLRSS